MSSNPASVGSCGCSPRDEAALRILLLVVDPDPSRHEPSRSALPFQRQPLSANSRRLPCKKRCDGVDCDQHTIESWALDPQHEPRGVLKLNHRDLPQLRNFRANDAAADGRNAQGAGVAGRFGEGVNSTRSTRSTWARGTGRNGEKAAVGAKGKMRQKPIFFIGLPTSRLDAIRDVARGVASVPIRRTRCGRFMWAGTPSFSVWLCAKRQALCRRTA